MREVISVSLPEKIASKLKMTVKETGRAKSEIIKEAPCFYLWKERFKKSGRG